VEGQSGRRKEKCSVRYTFDVKRTVAKALDKYKPFGRGVVGLGLLPLHIFEQYWVRSDLLQYNTVLTYWVRSDFLYYNTVLPYWVRSFFLSFLMWNRDDNKPDLIWKHFKIEQV